MTKTQSGKAITERDRRRSGLGLNRWRRADCHTF
jgi:hypothetical protein